MLPTTRLLLVGLNYANWLIGGLILSLLLFTAWPSVSAGVQAHLAQSFPGTDTGQMMVYMRLMMALVAPMIVAAHVALTRIVAMIDSVALGEAFAAINAVRLRQIGWAVLAAQIIDLAYGYIGPWLTRSTGEYFGWSFSLTGWLAVLLLFILARVFEEGAAMRTELSEVV